MPVLRRLNIPAPVVGGGVVALLLALVDGFLGVKLGFNLALKDTLLLMFFTTVGLAADARMLVKGGPRLLARAVEPGRVAEERPRAEPEVIVVRWCVLTLCAALATGLVWPDGAAQGQASEPVSRGRPLGEWREDLQGGTPMVRERAVVAICELGEPAVPLLVGAIADWDFNVRTPAIFCLGRLGAKAKEAVPVLVKTLEDRNWIVRRYAAGALGLLATTAGDAAPALARTAVEDSSAEVRQTAALALARLDPAARESAKTVLRQLGSSAASEAERNRAMEMLRDMEKR